MEIHAVNIIYDICIMSALMLIAKIIRTKIKIIYTVSTGCRIFRFVIRKTVFKCNSF